MKFSSMVQRKNSITYKTLNKLRIWNLLLNRSLLLTMFLAVACGFETKGLSCLNFLEFQPLAKIVAYKASLMKQNKCIYKFVSVILTNRSNRSKSDFKSKNFLWKIDPKGCIQAYIVGQNDVINIFCCITIDPESDGV